MGEVLTWADHCLRAFLCLILMLIPGTVFWLVVIAAVAIVRRIGTSLSQIIRQRTGKA